MPTCPHCGVAGLLPAMMKANFFCQDSNFLPAALWTQSAQAAAIVYSSVKPLKCPPGEIFPLGGSGYPHKTYSCKAGKLGSPWESSERLGSRTISASTLWFPDLYAFPPSRLAYILYGSSSKSLQTWQFRTTHMYYYPTFP